MRWQGLIEAYNEFLNSLVDVKKLPNNELAVTQHIKGVVNG